MKKNLAKICFFINLFTLLSNNMCDAQTFEWAKQIGGGSIDEGHSIAVDNLGNTYTTGIFEGTVDFDPGAGISNLASAGSKDIFISKLDASGNFVWAIKMGGASSDRSLSIALDGTGHVYTTGYFEGTSDFNPGVGTFNLTSVGSTDVFISKLDTSGNFVWAKSIGGTAVDYGKSLSVDVSGNVYSLGYFSGTSDFNSGVGFNYLTAAGSYDIFISKLDLSGNFVWAVRMGGLGWDSGSSITVDGSGNVYTTGYFEGTSDFDPGMGTYNLISAGGDDIFISKLDVSGNFIWAKRIGGASSETGYSIDVDSSGNVYTTGYFSGVIDFDPNMGISNLNSGAGNDIFISKLDGSGNFVWAKNMGGLSHVTGFFVVTDGSGNVYTTGYFGGTADFDPGAGVSNLISTGFNDIFISKLDASGNFVWAKSMGGANDDIGRSIAVDGSGNVYTTGHFEGIADFDPGAGISNLTSVGNNDIFVHKMSQSGVSIFENSSNSSVIAYPNPCDEHLNINFNQDINSKFSISVYDIKGVVLIYREFDNAEYTNPIQINTDRLANGLYYLKIKNVRVDEVRKFTVMHRK